MLTDEAIDFSCMLIYLFSVSYLDRRANKAKTLSDAI